MGKIFDTPRLSVRLFKESDALFIVELLNTDDWLRYIGDRGVKTIADAHRFLREGSLRTNFASKTGLCCVILKETNRPIGVCGIMKRDYLTAYDLGYSLLPDYYRKGYGYEMANAMLLYAKQVEGIEEMKAIIKPNNTASIKLAEKLGFVPEKMLKINTHDPMMLLMDIRL